MESEKCVYTACPGWGDHEFCALKTVVRDGKIHHTEKCDKYTGVEADEAFICQKGLTSWRQVYNEERLLHPLKRIGERGEGKWEEISWDQALDEIAAKLIEINGQYGPESLVVWNLPAAAPPQFGLTFSLGARFTALWGATDPLLAQGLDNGAIFSERIDLGAPMWGGTDPAIFHESQTIIVWGANPMENQQRVANGIIEAKSRGARVIDVGLVFDATAGWSDWFIPVKPGSDAALALACAKIMIDEGIYNHRFVLDHTVAPFLVNCETGKFLRDDQGNYYIWDTEQNAPVAYKAPTPGIIAAAGMAPAPKQKMLNAETTALLGTYDVNGAAHKPALQMNYDACAPWTPEAQEAVTGVSASDCVELAHILAFGGRTFYMAAYGMRYQNAGEAHRAITLLCALTGNYGEPGRGCGYTMMTSSHGVMFNRAAICKPLGDDPVTGQIKGPHLMRMNDFFREAREGKFKAFIKSQGNPVHNNPNRSRWEKDTFPNMELVVDYDIWMTDTGELADYVLPAAMPFERMDILDMAAYGHVVLQEPAVEPQGEAKPPEYFWGELAKRMGWAEWFDHTVEEWLDMTLDDPMLTDEAGRPFTVARLKEEKVIRAKTREGVADPFKPLAFMTDSGRIDLYSEMLAPIGEAVANYRPSMEFPMAEGAQFPYQFFSGRQRFFMQSMFTDDELMRELSGGKPYARMNPADAQREGLATGDVVQIFNQRGSMTCPVELDEAVPPGTVHAWFGWRARAFDEGTYAELTVPCGGDEAIDDLARFWWDRMVESKEVDSLAAGNLGSMAMAYGSWDTLWDCTCAVRKVADGDGAVVTSIASMTGKEA